MPASNTITIDKNFIQKESRDVFRLYRLARCGCLFEVIMRRHDIRNTMMTNNRPLEEWGKLIGDAPSATAILARFLHHSEVIQITGRSYRMGNSGKSSNSTKAPTGSATEEA